MALYKLTNTSSIIRTSDNAYIPADSGNRDYKKYLLWLAEPNTPDPADPPFEETWPGIRHKRDRLLKDADWTQLADCQLSVEDKALWASYRQELRDLPQEFATPLEVVWPTKPN